MLTGKELGAAIAVAIERKGVTKKAVADEFGVAPPSVQDWIKRGTIAKDKLPHLWAYFSDVADGAHWGLDSSAAPLAAPVTPLNRARAPRWPFPRIDEAKLIALDGPALRAIENAILATAGDLDIDVRPTTGKRRRA